MNISVKYFLEKVKWFEVGKLISSLDDNINVKNIINHLKWLTLTKMIVVYQDENKDFFNEL